MKINFAKFKSDNQVTLTAEDDEDLWNLYNLLSVGDILSSQTLRKVNMNNNSNNNERNSSQNKIVKIFVSISIKTIDYDIASSTIKINGTNCVENQYLKLGAHHSIGIELNRSLKLTKEHWDEIDRELLNEMKDSSRKSEVGAIILEEGVAHLCLIQSSSLQMLSKVSTSIPKKQKNFSNKYDLSLNRFYESIFAEMSKVFDLEKLKCIILASPAFYNAQLLDKIQEISTKNSNSNNFQKNKSKFILIHSSNGYLDSLNAILSDKKVLKQIEDLKISQELAIFEEFQRQLYENEYQAIYGYKHIKYCIDLHGSNCVKALMILDSLYRSKILEERKKYNDLVRDLKKDKINSKLIVFSSLTQSGKELSDLGGIAALLKYPIHEIDDIDF